MSESGEDEIYCQDCSWQGDRDQLVSKTDDDDDPCNRCPQCESDKIDDM